MKRIPKEIASTRLIAHLPEADPAARRVRPLEPAHPVRHPMADPCRPKAPDAEDDPAEDEAEHELQGKLHRQHQGRAVAYQVLRDVREGEDRTRKDPPTRLTEPSDQPSLKETAIDDLLLEADCEERAEPQQFWTADSRERAGLPHSEHCQHADREAKDELRDQIPRLESDRRWALTPDEQCRDDRREGRSEKGKLDEQSRQVVPRSQLDRGGRGQRRNRRTDREKRRDDDDLSEDRDDRQ